MTYTRERPRFRRGRGNGTTKINAADTTRTSPAQQAPTPKPRLHPYCFRLKDDRGGGVYLTPAPNRDAAQAELRSHWPNDLVVVAKLGGSKRRC